MTKPVQSNTNMTEAAPTGSAAMAESSHLAENDNPLSVAQHNCAFPGSDACFCLPTTKGAHSEAVKVGGYCYTDPLAAAWMAKHFKMKFLVKETSYGGTTREVEAGRNYMQEIISNSACCLYLSSESIALLEPAVGDIVRYWVTTEPDYFSQSEGNRTKEHIKKLTKSTMFYIKHQSGIHKINILQRNGIIFHMPLLEPQRQQPPHIHLRREP